MALSRLLSCATAAWLLAGCAHTGDAAEPTASSAEAEATVLRERVLRLERRLSDLDAQVALLTEKVADEPRRSVSLGAAPAYVPAPTSYAPPPSSSQTWSGYPAAEPSYDARRGWQNDAGTRSIDLGPGPPRSTPVELPPAQVEDTVEHAPLAEVVGSRSSTTANTTASAPPPTAAASADPHAQYEEARARMQDGRYLEAVAGFTELLARHAQHDLADNAVYWIGVCHLERGEPRLAIDTWKTLPLRFPSSAKMPDSLYGMALAHEELGEPVLAETLYGQLLQQYPKAEKVSEARKALKRLRGAPDAPR